MLLTEAIKSGIREGSFAPGQRLIEKDLVDEFNISRGSVREALRLLATEGVVEIEHNRGARIRQFSREEVWALHQIREVLEGLGAALAAGRNSDAKLRASLLSILKESESAVAQNRSDLYARCNERFHGIILEMSGNGELGPAIERAQLAQFRLQSERFIDEKEMARSHAEHKTIVDAIIRADSAGAETAMRRHIQSTRKLILQAPDKFFRVVHPVGAARSDV